MTKPTGRKVGRPATGQHGAYTFRLPTALIARISKVTEDTAVGQSARVSRSAIVRKALVLALAVMEREAKSRKPGLRLDGKKIIQR